MIQEEADKRQELERVLTSVKGQPLVVLISGHPDPDAIGSALAHQRICERLGVPATVAHVLPLSRSENRAIVKLLNIQMVPIQDATDLEKFAYLSLVDTSKSEPSIDLPEHLRLLTVVDHHRGPLDSEAEFVDIRLGVGATSTIYAEYLQQGLFALSPNNRDDLRLATALLFGIQTDTDSFALASPADFQAAGYLKPFSDTSVLHRVSDRVVAAEAMDVLGRALADLEVVRDFAIAGVGPVSTSNRDAIGAAADFILRREDIDTVLVYGLVGDRIDGSLRTTSPSVDPAAFLETAFGKDVRGRPYGGGRAEKGGFQIPLGLLADVEDEGVLWQFVREVVRRRCAQVVPALERSAGVDGAKRNAVR